MPTKAAVQINPSHSNKALGLLLVNSDISFGTNEIISIATKMRKTITPCNTTLTIAIRLGNGEIRKNECSNEKIDQPIRKQAVKNRNPGEIEGIAISSKLKQLKGFQPKTKEF